MPGCRSIRGLKPAVSRIALTLTDRGRRNTIFRGCSTSMRRYLLKKLPSESKMISRDFAGGAAGKMATEIKRIFPNDIIQHVHSRGTCSLGKLTKHGHEVGLIQLKGMMQDISSEHNLLAIAIHGNSGVIDALARHQTTLR